MQKKFIQMPLPFVYDEIEDAINNQQPEFLSCLDNYIDFDKLIPSKFKLVYYKREGRKHKYRLESFIRAFILKAFLGITTVASLIAVLKCSTELRDFCGFDTVPHASIFSRFLKDYCTCIRDMFYSLVEQTEPICREINPKKADYLIYDTTGIVLLVAENNPKFFNTKLKQAKALAKNKSDCDPYKLVYSLFPDKAKANPDAKEQYINGHFCYAIKAGIVTNGLGIPRHITVFDDEFFARHKDINITSDSDPTKSKEIGDSTSLKPVLSDFFSAHKNLSYKTFIGDAAFDSYDNYAMLKNEFGFERICIPLNKRNGKSTATNFDEFGAPLCPVDGSKFICLGKSGGKHRSPRIKWVCRKSIAKGRTRRLICEQPCTTSKYGKCVYTYPNKNLRLYPGIERDTVHWDNLYRHRVCIERSINTIKETFMLDGRKSRRTITAKADLYLAGMIWLVAVILAKAMCKIECYKSIRKLAA